MGSLKICELFGCLIFVLVGPSQQIVAPPSAFHEHWHGHNEVVTRVYFNNDLAVYYDQKVSPNLYWPYSFLTAVWQHTKGVYSNFGSDPKLYAVVHSDNYGDGIQQTFLDNDRGNRNILDVDLGSMSQWPLEEGPALDMVTRQVARIVENSAYGCAGNPAQSISRNKFAEIFVYDVYKGLARFEDLTRWYNSRMKAYEQFPRPNTQWFKDWFYPIYVRHGGSNTLRRFFYNLYYYFPKANNRYTRLMNWGEFVHFWSSAANKNLKYLATLAFGWSNATEAEFVQARTQFKLTYPN